MPVTQLKEWGVGTAGRQKVSQTSPTSYLVGVFRRWSWDPSWAENGGWGCGGGNDVALGLWDPAHLMRWYQERPQGA